MAHASEEPETSNVFEIATEALASKSRILTHQDMINELYIFVARLEGKLAGITADVRTTDENLKQFNHVDLVSDDSREGYEVLQEQVNQVVWQQLVAQMNHPPRRNWTEARTEPG